MCDLSSNLYMLTHRNIQMAANICQGVTAVHGTPNSNQLKLSIFHIKVHLAIYRLNSSNSNIAI